jgi:hypothetical protein
MPKFRRELLQGGEDLLLGWHLITRRGPNKAILASHAPNPFISENLGR